MIVLGGCKNVAQWNNLSDLLENYLQTSSQQSII